MLKNRKFKFSRIFYNNKFLVIFSIVLAFIVWLVIAANDSQGRIVTISDIPITINLSDQAVEEGLRVFSGQDNKAEVSITGNRIVVGQVKSSDIQVSAPQSVNTITSPGNYTLELVAKKVGLLSNYDIVSSVSPNFLTVVVDRYREVEMDVEDAIKYKADPDYFVSTTTFSSPTVKISGPETQIAKIEKVVAEGKISETLKESKTISSNLVLYDSYGEKITSDLITLSVDKVDATVPVLLRKELPLKVAYTNKPSGLNLTKNQVKVSPSKLEIAADRKVFDNLKEISLKALDFSKIKAAENKFELQVDLPSGCKNLSNTYSAEVAINMSNMRSKSFSINQFAFANVPSDRNAESKTSNITVSVIGPRSQISRLKSSDITAVVDFKDKEYFTGRKEMPVEIKIANKTSCWAYGTYKADIEVKSK